MNYLYEYDRCKDQKKQRERVMSFLSFLQLVPYQMFFIAVLDYIITSFLAFATFHTSTFHQISTLFQFKYRERVLIQLLKTNMIAIIVDVTVLCEILLISSEALADKSNIVKLTNKQFVIRYSYEIREQFEWANSSSLLFVIYFSCRFVCQAVFFHKIKEQFKWYVFRSII